VRDDGALAATRAAIEPPDSEVLTAYPTRDLCSDAAHLPLVYATLSPVQSLFKKPDINTYQNMAWSRYFMNYIETTKSF